MRLCHLHLATTSMRRCNLQSAFNNEAVQKVVGAGQAERESGLNFSPGKFRCFIESDGLWFVSPRSFQPVRQFGLFCLQVFVWSA